MNTAEEHLPALDPDALDRLVDGELPDAERRRLLERLDRTPGGWRACALVFLEAQCLNEALAPAVREPEPSSAQSARPVTDRPWKSAIGTILAMAACFLIALGVGMAVRSGWFSGRPDAPGENFASVAPPSQNSTTRTSPGPANSMLAADRNPASQPRPEPRGRQLEAPPIRSAPTVVVDLRNQPGRVPEPFDLPVTARDRLDESWFHPAPVPPHVREMLRRMGYEIQQSRDLLPAQMDDGRRVVVPVDEWKVHFVGNRAFQ